MISRRRLLQTSPGAVSGFALPLAHAAASERSEECWPAYAANGDLLGSKA
jgi:hypothetical protein